MAWNCHDRLIKIQLYGAMPFKVWRSTSPPMLGPWFSNIHSQMVTKHALSSCPISCYEISQCIVALHTSKLLFIWYSPFLQNLESAWCWIVRQTRGWEMTIFSVIECDCYFLQFAILQDWLKKWTIFAKLYADLSFPQMPWNQANKYLVILKIALKGLF